MDMPTAAMASNVTAMLIINVSSCCIWYRDNNRRAQKSQGKHKKVVALVARMVGGMIAMEVHRDHIGIISCQSQPFSGTSGSVPALQ